MSKFDIPVLMLVFNRPELTQQVLERVLEIHPSRLYVVADGPRVGREDDKVKSEQTKALFSQIPKDVELKTLFRTENWGCKRSVSDGISWFFSQEEMGIILEDDCLPDLSFFSYMRELLNHYKDDKRIMHISGNNFQFGKKRGNGASYYFSHFTHIWGWGTWRRAWMLYDLEMRGLDSFTYRYSHKDFHWEWYFFYKYMGHFRKVAENKIDTWDYQWHFTMWNNKGLGINPDVNLVENIGFGVDATHTVTVDSILSRIPTQQITFPLIHPTNIHPDFEADNYTLQLLYGKSWLERIKKFIKNKIG